MYSNNTEKPAVDKFPTEIESNLANLSFNTEYNNVCNKVLQPVAAFLVFL